MTKEEIERFEVENPKILAKIDHLYISRMFKEWEEQKMHGIEINKKYVKAFKFGKWPTGETKWCVGRWDFGDNVAEFIYPENFESKKEAQAFMAKLNLEEQLNGN